MLSSVWSAITCFRFRSRDLSRPNQPQQQDLQDGQEGFNTFSNLVILVNPVTSPTFLTLAIRLLFSAGQNILSRWDCQYLKFIFEVRFMLSGWGTKLNL
jgi:hypothetical protein